MIKNIKLLAFLIAILSLAPFKFSAQIKSGELVDGITAVIGNEIVLESDIDEQMNYAKQQGMPVTNKCEFLESIINNKMLIYEAKKDTLIENRSETFKQIANQKYSQILSQFPDEKTMLNAYKFRTSYEMKNAIEKIDTDQYYMQQKYGLITSKTDITPTEVREFYNTYKSQLPEVKEEVGLSQIFIYPKLTDAHKEEIIAKLKKIKQDILNGESFESQARIYSEDPGSVSTGGVYTNIAKGKMVKSFEATALNLQEGEISDPVESEFGYHIIKLIKRNGKLYDAAHILLEAKPNEEEIAAAKKELDSIRTQIAAGKLTFKEAAFKYSEDKSNKFNAGIMTSQDGSDKLERTSLAPSVSYQIAGLNKGDMTEVFEDTYNNRRTVNLIKINETTPAHQLDITTDFERLKMMALNKKKGDVVDKWIKERIPNVFISINDRYQDCDFKSNWRKK